MNTGTTSNQVFKRLACTALAVDIFTAVVSEPTLDTAIGVGVVGGLLVALIWTSARRARRWAVGGLMVYFGYSALATLGELWIAAPDWLRNAFPPSENIYVPVIDVVTLLLMGAALAVYFSNLSKTQGAQI
jgi:hypothetical protein